MSLRAKVPTRALIRIPKNEGTRDYQIGWSARSRRLVFFETIKPALKTKGVAVAASQDSQPGVSFAELSAFPPFSPFLSRFSPRFLACLFSLFSSLFFMFDSTTMKSQGRNTSTGNESDGCRCGGVEVKKKGEDESRRVR